MQSTNVRTPPATIGLMSVPSRSPFTRHAENPILTADAVGGDAVLVFNPGVVRWGDGFLMAVRIDEGAFGDPHITGSRIGFATSSDGIDWEVDHDRSLDRAASIAMLGPLEPHRDLESEVWRIYDPRLCVLAIDGADTLVLTFATDTTHGLRPGIATSVDGHHFMARSLGPPDDRNNVVFPERIDGAWWRLQRPMHDYGGEALGAGRYGVWTSNSPDGEHWGNHRFVVDRGRLPFANDKVGPGAPPVRTDRGWLCIVHTVSVDPAHGKRGWEPEWHKTYEAGAILLDLDDPSRLIAAAATPALSPETEYEREGFRNDVIFPTGALVVGDDLHVYYGAADTSIAVATAPVDAVVDWVLSSDGGPN